MLPIELEMCTTVFCVLRSSKGRKACVTSAGATVLTRKVERSEEDVRVNAVSSVH